MNEKQTGSGLAALALAAALAAPAASAAEPAPDAAPTANAIAVVEQMFAAWHERDWERAYALFHEDGVLHSMMMEPIVGRAAIRARLEPLLAGIERIDLEVRRIGVVDGAVVVERVDDFVFRGHAGRVPVVGVLEVEDGLIKVWREYYDHAQLRAAMGVAAAEDHSTPPGAQ